MATTTCSIMRILNSSILVFNFDFDDFLEPNVFKKISYDLVVLVSYDLVVNHRPW